MNILSSITNPHVYLWDTSEDIFNEIREISILKRIRLHNDKDKCFAFVFVMYRDNIVKMIPIQIHVLFCQASWRCWGTLCIDGTL